MISNWSILGVPEITTKPRPKRPNADKAARAGRDGGNPQKSANLRIELSQPVAGLWHAFWNPSLTGGTTDATGAAWDGFFDLYPRDSLHPMLELPACKSLSVKSLSWCATYVLRRSFTDVMCPRRAAASGRLKPSRTASNTAKKGLLQAGKPGPARCTRYPLA